MNENIASLYIGKEITLIAIIEKTDIGHSLLYLNSLKATLDPNDLLSESSAQALSEFGTIMADFKEKYGITNISKFFVTLAHYYCHFTTIPGNLVDSQNNKLHQDFIDLVNLEISHIDASKTIDNFKIKAIPIKPGTGHEGSELLTIIDKNMVLTLESVLANFDCELTDINSVPVSAINAFTYNYPDDSDKSIILVQVFDNILEFGIIINNEIVGYEFYTVDTEQGELPDNQAYTLAIESKLTSIAQAYHIEQISCVYYYGEKLMKEHYLNFWEVGMICGNNSKRLNPFRMMNTNLTDRDKEYCARTFQMYVACIGGALPGQLPISIF